MSALADDDHDRSNNQSGFIGIEIESITKRYVRNVWLKEINWENSKDQMNVKRFN